ncbi:polysaccharide deacetylase family protein [Dysosmobacter sp.]
MGKRWLVLLLLCLTAVLGRGAEEIVTVNAPAAEIPAETKYIALTFDDGPRMGTTDRLLDGLKERGASATFFLVGERVAENRQLVERMAAEGHQIGNHTWSHVRLQGAGEATIRQEIRKTQETLEQLVGKGDYWLRPPYGQMDEKERSYVSVPMVQWSVDPRDWEKRDVQKVKKAVLAAAKPNVIILMHDIYPTSVDAALEIVDALEEQGYIFVTVKELLALNGITPQPGVLYRSGKG